MRAITLAYAFLSAALYCSLMPLWEGFDELYHYAYVQHVANTHTFPVVGKTTLSRELWTSLDFLPVSHYIQPYLGRSSTSFDEYFHLTAEQRPALRRGVDSIDRTWPIEPSPHVTYEAMQAPITYLLLAPVEIVLSAAPLMTRVLALRLFLSFITVALLWIGTRRLARRLDLPPSSEATCLFVVFSCQMFYAETCRVGNDALTAPWLLFFLIAVADSIEFPGFKHTITAAVIMAVGLLIKSSLLFLVPLAFAAPVLLTIRRTWTRSTAAQHMAVSAAVLCALAGPWYLRNILLYGNLTAHEATAGVGVKTLFHAAAALPWRRSIVELAHSSLWTGNNSFTTFSAATLNVVLAVLGVAIVLYCLPARRIPMEPVVLAAIALYSMGLILVTLSFFLSSKGLVIGPMPWYQQILLTPIAALAFLGLSRQPPWGRWIGILTVVLWAYVAAVSWLAKLIPMYGGLEQPHARPGELLAWYLHNAAQRNSVLSNLCPAPLQIVYLLLVGVLVTLIIACCCTCFSLCQLRKRFRAPPDKSVAARNASR